jgi:hypothetical protein
LPSSILEKREIAHARHGNGRAVRVMRAVRGPAPKPTLHRLEIETHVVVAAADKGGYVLCPRTGMRTTGHSSYPVVAAARRAECRRAPPVSAEADGRRRDDWALAFAVRLAWLGAGDGIADLARLGRALYEHYNLLDPYHIARMVWRRRPKDGAMVVRRVP